MSSAAAAAAATTTLLLFSILVVFTATVVEPAHHSAAPAPSVDCSNVILGLADCLSFVTAGSVVTKPEGTCCSGLKTVLKINAECLCEGFKNSAQLGVSLNMTKALSLPAVCHLRAPPLTNCGISIGAAPAPAHSPSAMSPGSGSGSFELAPSTGLAPVPQGASGSSILVASAVTLVLGLLVTASHALL